MSIARTATLNVRIEPQAKTEAEKVFSGLGLSMSDAINIFLKQVAYRQSIPFELEIPGAPAHLDATNWTKDKLREEIQKGIKSAETERTYSVEEVFNELMGA